MKVYTFASLKGGTGKSSTTITAASCFAAASKKVLVIDMDINNSVSFYFLQNSNESGQKNIAYALQSDNLSDFIITTKNENIDIIPSSLRLVDLRAMSTSILKRLMTSLNNRYDAVFIDTAPTYDNIVLNAINAADYIITPINYDQFNFNTSIFLSQKLRLETESFDKWFLFFNGYESRYDGNPESLQNQYHLLFSQHDILGKKLLPVRFPFTRNMRKFADTNEALCNKGQTEKLHKAVCELCSILLEEEINPEKF
jgi:virC1 protein